MGKVKMRKEVDTAAKVTVIDVAFFFPIIDLVGLVRSQAGLLLHEQKLSVSTPADCCLLQDTAREGRRK